MNSFGHAMKIASLNWKTMLKSVLIQLLVFAVIAAICFWAFYDVYVSISELITEINFDGSVSNVILEISSGSLTAEEIFDSIVEIIDKVINAIGNLPSFLGQITFSYFLALLILCVYRMAIGCCDVPVMCQINEFMTCNSTRPFTWYFFKKMVLSLRFLFWQFLLGTLFDLVVIAASIGLYFIFLPIFHGAAFPVAVVCSLLLYTLRQSLFAFWLPCLITDAYKKPLKALSVALCKIPLRFWNVFWKYLVLLSAAVAVWLGIFVLQNIFVGVGYLMFISTAVSFLCFFCIKCVAVTEYFEEEKRPYFTVRIKLPTTKEIAEEN